MVRDAHDAVESESDRAPRMLHQPADAPTPLGHVGETEAVRSLRRIRSDRKATKRSFRSWAGRVSGRADRRLLLALTDAMEATAMQCDLLADRLAAQEAVTADVAGALGQEVTQLRAEVAHLQRSLDTLRDPAS
jgi:uncharacterized protein YceH (UPF0502 family)